MNLSNINPESLDILQRIADLEVTMGDVQARLKRNEELMLSAHRQIGLLSTLLDKKIGGES